MKENYVLPSESEKAQLKAKYGELLVVPVPYARPDDKVKVYIIRQLNRTQWRAMEEKARNISKDKPNVNPDELFHESIVSLAVVWPPLPEHEIAKSAAGLVPTLFGVVQQKSLFFNPEVLMNLTFTL
jgi:hypothetical protein